MLDCQAGTRAQRSTTAWLVHRRQLRRGGTDAIVNAVNHAGCDNGLFCDGAETCDVALDCQVGIPPVLDDGIGCTDDSCDEAGDQVVSIPNDANCDDALFCNGVETCDVLLDCQVGTAPPVDDGISCTIDACDEVGDVITNVVSDALCSNGVFCDGAEVCSLAPAVEHVIVISVDGLASYLLEGLITSDPGGDFANFERFLDEGATTYNARTDYTQTVTLPNHTSMMTGRPAEQPSGQPNTLHHGYLDNGQPGPTWTLHNHGNSNVSYIASAWDVAHDNELVTSLYASKIKFDIFDQSYDATTGAPDVTGPDDGPDKIDFYVNKSNAIVDPNILDSTEMHADFLADMATERFNFTFLHYTEPDKSGHHYGWGTPQWDDTVRQVDGFLGDLFDLIENDPVLDERTVVILTSDHGGSGTGHFEVNNPLHYRIPFLVWGAGVPAGADLYALNPTSRQAPSTPGRPDYNAALQPVRDGDAGNLALSLLGLGPVPGSMINAAQNLFVGTPPAAGCRAGPVLVLDDGVGCTVDSCDEGNDLIVNELNHAACDNGLFCDGAETCDALLDCQAGFAPTIDDGIGCTDDSCDEIADLVLNTADDASCDNGLFCDGAETCDTLLDCQAGTEPTIDDGVGCTDDSCDEASDLVVNAPNHAFCDNGAFCDGAETCDPALDCVAAVPPALDDGVGCTDDSCDEATDAIVNAVNHGNCDNGLFCDGAETCDAALDCQAGTAPSIDDGISCTDDSCDEATDAIVHSANDGNCDNGLFCDGAESCDAALDCQAGTAPSIDDGIGCTDDSCDEAAEAIVHSVNDGNCDNGLFCDGTARRCDPAPRLPDG